MTIHSPEPIRTAAPADARARLLRYAFMKLTRDLDSRFEALLLTGRVSKWYSEVGSEATTIPAGLALGAGRRPVHAPPRPRRHPRRLSRSGPRLPRASASASRTAARPDPDHLMHRLACQLLGKGDGFSQGVERSFHYGYLAPEHGILHIGMISHLGAMIPVAAGCAFAFRQSGSDRVAINFIGEGGTSTGDFHEGLNMAAVWKLPLILVIENNRYAFSTPARLQYAAEQPLRPRHRLRRRRRDGGRQRSRRHGRGLRPRRGPRPRRRGADPDRGHARPHARPRRGGRFAQGGARRRARRLPRRRSGARLRPPPRGGGRAGRRHPRAAGGARSPRWSRPRSRGAIDAPPPADEIAMRAGLRPRSAAPGGRRGAGRSSSSRRDGREITYVDAINQALLEEMERDASVVLMGQDIGVFEGAFRTTRGLYARWPEPGARHADRRERHDRHRHRRRRSSATGRWSRCSSATSSPAASTSSSTWRPSSTTAGRCPARSSSACPPAAAWAPGPSTRRTPRGGSRTRPASRSSARPRRPTPWACSRRRSAIPTR